MSIRLILRYGNAAAAGIILITFTGCGGTYDSKVSGAVTLDGSAISRGTVTYAPTGGGPAGYARIDDGKYTVYTGREVGLPSGEYQVTVISNEAAASQENANGGPPPPGKALTPMWYRSKETSGLKFTVKKGSNNIDLELTSKAPAGWKQSPARK